MCFFKSISFENCSSHLLQENAAFGKTDAKVKPDKHSFVISSVGSLKLELLMISFSRFTLVSNCLISILFYTKVVFKFLMVSVCSVILWSNLVSLSSKRVSLSFMLVNSFLRSCVHIGSKSVNLHLPKVLKNLHSFGCRCEQLSISQLTFSHCSRICLFRQVSLNLQKPNLWWRQTFSVAIFENYFWSW